MKKKKNLKLEKMFNGSNQKWTEISESEAKERAAESYSDADDFLSYVKEEPGKEYRLSPFAFIRAVEI